MITSLVDLSACLPFTIKSHCSILIVGNDYEASRYFHCNVYVWYFNFANCDRRVAWNVVLQCKIAISHYYEMNLFNTSEMHSFSFWILI